MHILEMYKPTKFFYTGYKQRQSYRPRRHGSIAVYIINIMSNVLPASHIRTQKMHW